MSVAEAAIPYVLVFLFAFTLGQYVGAALEAWNWRMSGDSHHHSHKSGGRWWKVHPE